MSPISQSALPIEDVIPDIRAALRAGSRLVIAAPPGAGKTTRVPLALLDDAWASQGKLILVEPRRIAARAAAERMAATLGDTVGRTIGLRSRLDVRTSPAARVDVVTEGVFSRMILDDPALDGVAAVIFDEFHERSLDADEGLAFALDAQAVLRPDLRIVLMSATLDVARVSAFLDAPVVASEGRAWPVETVYLGGDARTRLEDQVAVAVRRALADQDGSVLAFLPGAAEIARTAERLRDLPASVLIAPLYGALSPADQTAAISPAPAGHRKIVLATDIAESALTIEGVRIVVDAGFSRVPRYDAALGASRLETVRVSIASADQRRGRAGRLGPGVCYRLWREAEGRGFSAHGDPEIRNTDLSGLALDLARWGAATPESLRWLDPPPETAMRLARDRLTRAGALDANGVLTARGQAAGKLGLPPGLALMLLKAAGEGQASLAAEIAALLSERDLGGRSTDVADRLPRFREDRGQRGRAMRDLARRWAREARGDAGTISDPHESGAIIAAAFPERIARARPGAPGRFIMAGGRGCRLDETDPLARETWLAVAEVTGAGPDLRITLAARLDAEAAARLGGAETIDETRYDPATTGIRVRRIRRIGAIVLDEQPLPSPTPELIQAGLLTAVREQGLSILPNRDALDDLLARVAFLAKEIGPPWPENFADVLAARMDEWLAPALAGARSLAGADGSALADAAVVLLEWPLPREIDQLAPRSWTTPAGRVARIDYGAEGGPQAACKVQEAFGPGSHPMIAGGRTALAVSLLSPAQRPVALTRDLPAFWRAGYRDLRKDMRGRYPKHDWPEDPAAALATSRAKPRGT